MNDLIKEYSLPDLPGEDGGDRDLILFRRDSTNEVIARNVTLEDAREYCNREDTHGDGWFTGYDKADPS